MLYALFLFINKLFQKTVVVTAAIEFMVSSILFGSTVTLLVQLWVLYIPTRRSANSNILFLKLMMMNWAFLVRSYITKQERVMQNIRFGIHDSSLEFFLIILKFLWERAKQIRVTIRICIYVYISLWYNGQLSKHSWNLMQRLFHPLHTEDWVYNDVEQIPAVN